MIPVYQYLNLQSLTVASVQQHVPTPPSRFLSQSFPLNLKQWWQQSRRPRVKIFEGSLKILKDLHEDLWGSCWGFSWGSLENLLRSLKFLLRSSRIFIFLPRSSRIFHFLAKILKDLSFSCQDLQGSFIFLPRSSRIFHFLAKIFKDLWRSSQDLHGSLKILARSLGIFYFLATTFKDLSFSC